MASASAASLNASLNESIGLAYADQAGVCLFCIEGQRFALDTAAVGEVTTATRMLPVPMVPTPVIGLFSLRGTPVAVVDLLVLLGERQVPAPLGRDGTTLLVLRTDHPIAALRIDRLEKVLPQGVGRRVLLDEQGVHAARVGLFEPPTAQPAVILLGARPLIATLLQLCHSDNPRGDHEPAL